MDSKFPSNSDGIVRMGNEIWIFKKDKIYIIDQNEFNTKLNVYTNLFDQNNLAECQHYKFTPLNLSLIKVIYDKRGKDFSLTNQSSNIKFVSSFVKFGCPNKALEFILTNIGLFNYLYYHFGLLIFLIILFLLFWPLSVLIICLYLKIYRSKRQQYFTADQGHRGFLRTAFEMPTQSKQEVQFTDEENDEITSIRLPIKGLKTKFNKLIDKVKNNDNQTESRSDVSTNVEKINERSID